MKDTVFDPNVDIRAQPQASKFKIHGHPQSLMFFTPVMLICFLVLLIMFILTHLIWLDHRKNSHIMFITILMFFLVANSVSLTLYLCFKENSLRSSLSLHDICTVRRQTDIQHAHLLVNSLSSSGFHYCQPVSWVSFIFCRWMKDVPSAMVAVRLLVLSLVRVSLVGSQPTQGPQEASVPPHPMGERSHSGTDTLSFPWSRLRLPRYSPH